MWNVFVIEQTGPSQIYSTLHNDSIGIGFAKTGYRPDQLLIEFSDGENTTSKRFDMPAEEKVPTLKFEPQSAPAAPTVSQEHCVVACYKA